MLELIDGGLGSLRQLGEAEPNQHGTGNMVALGTLRAALRALYGELFGLTMKLLNLPAGGVLGTHSIRGILRAVVGDHMLRALGDSASRNSLC